ncbi:hypothetical protein BurJ1DRAFT_4127 [Burkholderiales bacterium JOSHI_001]|nr:hypothetical protein BurJ1DRAFT_4127 [Burkholderiales bacterium JOSHI_001]
MLSSSKLMAVIVALYTLVGVLPVFDHAIVKVPGPAVQDASWAAVLFMLGTVGGFMVSQFGRSTISAAQDQWLADGFRLALATLLLASLYVLAAGPTPPMLSAAMGESSFDAALLREDALKLSGDRVFVQVYSQTRDIVVPVVFTLGLRLLLQGRASSVHWAWPALGVLLSMFIGAWSGQKATIINYLLAAMLCLAPSVPAMGLWAVRALPVVALLLAATFLATTGEFFSASSDELGLVLEAVWEGFVYRVFEGPLEVSAAFVDAVDRGHLLQPVHVLPGLRWLDPWPTSVENRIGMEYFYTGIDSISANGLAFAYAYVAGGWPGALLGGLLCALVLSLCVRIARAGGSPFLCAAYEAYLAYLVLDLLNSNFMDYLIKALVISLGVWVMSRWQQLLPRRQRADGS